MESDKTAYLKKLMVVLLGKVKCSSEVCKHANSETNQASFVVLSARVEKEIEGFHQMFHEASDGKREYERVKEVFKK